LFAQPKCRIHDAQIAHKKVDMFCCFAFLFAFLSRQKRRSQKGIRKKQTQVAIGDFLFQLYFVNKRMNIILALARIPDSNACFLFMPQSRCFKQHSCRLSLMPNTSSELQQPVSLLETIMIKMFPWDILIYWHNFAMPKLWLLHSCPLLVWSALTSYPPLIANLAALQNNLPWAFK
jgi:hypothetical protein